MKLFCSILISLFSLQLSAQNQFTITGKIDTIKTGYIWLTIFYPDTRITDTVEIINGKYTFSGRINRPYQAKLDIADGKADYCYFIIEPKSIAVSGVGYPLKDWKIKGSISNDQDNLLNQLLFGNTKKISALDSLSKKTNEDDSLNLVKIDKKWEILNKEKIILQKKFIKQNHTFSRSVLLLQELFLTGMVEKEFYDLYNNLSPTIKKSVIGKELKNSLTKTQSVFPSEIKQKDTLGNVVALSSLKGKYVLIDFWASWCIPCREENPGLVKLYNKYKSNELEFLSVSYDDDKEDWKRAITQDSLTWLQVSELNGWQNSTSKSYNIFAIPQNILIDKKGKRVGKNLTNEQLEKIFEGLFPKK